MTNVASGADDAGAETIEVVNGRVSAPFVQVPLWVVFGASAKARALYEAIAAHRDWWAGGNRSENVTLSVLAELIDVKKPSSVHPYVRELVELGAIDVVRRKTVDGMNAPNVYVIHTEPPDGFTGPRTVKEYRALRDAKIPGRPVVPSSGPRKNTGERDKSSTQNRDKSDKNRESAVRPVVPSRGLRSPLQRTPVVPSSGPISRSSFKNQTPPLTPRTEPSRLTPAGSEGGESPDGNLETAFDLLSSLPAPVSPGRPAIRELIPLVAAALAEGWTAEALTRHLTVDLPGHVRSVRSFLARRLEDRPAPPAASPVSVPRPARCEDSRHRHDHPEMDRFLYDGDTPIGLCPTCGTKPTTVSASEGHSR